MMSDFPFHVFREIGRVYSIFVITEDGIYKEGEVPEDYNGSGELKVEVVHEIFKVDSAGRVRHTYYDIPDAKDREGKYGGGYTNTSSSHPIDASGNYVDHEWYPNQGVGGDSTVRTKLYYRKTNRLTTSNVAKADYMLSHYKKQKTAEQTS